MHTDDEAQDLGSPTLILNLVAIFCGWCVSIVQVGCAAQGALQLEESIERLGAHLSDGAPPTELGLPIAGELLPELSDELWQPSQLRTELTEELAALDSSEETVELFLSPGLEASATKTEEGWRFTTNPLEIYRTDTPISALRAFVWASRHGRWSALLELAPARFRAGSTIEGLETAWTDGPGSGARRQARDEIASGLGRVVQLDADRALLVADTGRRIRLEREGSRWVVAGY